jgi:hypothetical protein
MGEWRYRSTIIGLGTSWRRVVSFSPLPLHPRGKSPPAATGRYTKENGENLSYLSRDLSYVLVIWRKERGVIMASQK